MNSNRVKVISDLIEKNQRIFKIPVYQRNYDWKIHHCEKLLNEEENIDFNIEESEKEQSVFDENIGLVAQYQKHNGKNGN